MRHLARLFLIVFLLAGLAAAPAASFAAPQGHEMHPAVMAQMDASMHAHHMMMQTEKAQPKGRPIMAIMPPPVPPGAPARSSRPSHRPRHGTTPRPHRRLSQPAPNRSLASFPRPRSSRQNASSPDVTAPRHVGANDHITKANTMNRREFLKTAGLAAGGLAASQFVPRFGLATPGPRQLTIDTRTLEVKGKAATVYGLTENGKPGLTFAPGESFSVALSNRLKEDTIIHWHGLTRPGSRMACRGQSAAHAENPAKPVPTTSLWKRRAHSGCMPIRCRSRTCWPPR